LKRLKPGVEISILPDLACILEDGKTFAAPNVVRFNRPMDYSDLERIGRIPLPPYIARDPDAESEEQTRTDREYYQTVYAKDYGSVAAPTAGLHFTEALLDRIRSRGVRIARVTLDVSWGTFRPVQSERIEDHKMHAERYHLDAENADLIRSCKGRRIPVGTTSCRVLETLMEKFGEIRPDSGETSIFLYPGKQLRSTDCLITNFHLPKSTLLMLVAAFIGFEETLRIYKIAVEERYKFFSYGDAMFLDRST
jgi:S-adenosylmethionine:tRNA ribosyltransferase-isomerase